MISGSDKWPARSRSRSRATIGQRTRQSHRCRRALCADGSWQQGRQTAVQVIRGAIGLPFGHQPEAAGAEDTRREGEGQAPYA